MSHKPFMCFLSVFTVIFPVDLQLAAQEKKYCLGVVIDAGTGQAVPSGILINPADSSFICNVNMDGSFSFDYNEGSIPSIAYRGLGYEMDKYLFNEATNSILILVSAVSTQLSDVAVVAFLDRNMQSSTAASTAYIDRRKLEATDQTSLQNALNTIPGVVMDTRGYGGSHRISIRGSALRSPFAVRNVKMYFEGIPLTSPDGQAPLELIDAADIGSVEVIKGPAGSVWGSGNGGVLLFKARRPLNDIVQVGSGFQAGEFGLMRSNSFVNIGTQSSGLRISHSWQQNDGYREQEFNRKNQVSLLADHQLNRKNSLLAFLTYYNGNWGLPGAITATQVNEDPTQAVQFSKDANASVWRERLMGAITHNWKMNEAHELKTSVYYYSTDKENPYGTSAFSNGYKVEGADGAGGRISFSSQKKFNEKFQLAVDMGGEYQFEQYNISETENDMGAPGTFRYYFEVDYDMLMGFVNTRLDWYDKLFLNAGCSINAMKQQVGSYTFSTENADSTLKMKSALLPRVALSTRLVREIFAFASASYGNSYPTIFEFVDTEIFHDRDDLQAERGVSYELGMKGFLKETGLQFEASVYEFTLSDAIVQTKDSLVSGGLLFVADVYQNAGSTTQDGIEVSISKTFFNRDTRNGLRTWVAASTNEYWFSDYVTNGNDLTGNKLPGVALNTLHSGMSFTYRKNLRMDVMHYWVDRMPLDNENTVWSSAYHLLNARLNYALSVFDYALGIETFAGANNILDTVYTSFFQLNGVGGKYYNPAPSRNFFAGFNLRWTIDRIQSNSRA